MTDSYHYSQHKIDMPVYSIPTVVLVAAMGEVHANNVQPNITKLVDGLNRVRLGANRADDRRAAEVTGRREGSIELGEPVDSAAELEMVKGCGCHSDTVSVWCLL